MKHLFIINGLAKTERKKKKALTQLMAQIDRLEGDVEVQFTEHPDWGAERIARTAAEKGEPLRIYACGGDGTLNEVVNGMAGYDHVAVTNVPLGTGNDFLKIFGEEYRELFSDVSALMEGPQTQFDLMDCSGRLGIDVICSGVDARIAADVDKYKEWPLVSGMGAYILAMIENVALKGINRPMRVQMGGKDVSGDTAVVCVCNGRHYGGGFMPVGHAMPDDGILDMLMIKKVSLFTFVRLVGHYAKGEYQNYPKYIDHFHGQEISYASLSDEDIVTVVDGEVMRGREFSIKLSDKKVNFFYPAGADYLVKGTLPEAEAKK